MPTCYAGVFKVLAFGAIVELNLTDSIFLVVPLIGDEGKNFLMVGLGVGLLGVGLLF